MSQTDSMRSNRKAYVFQNPPADKIADLLRSARIIAVVGLSADPSRPSNRVAQQLQRFGYRIIPVTPTGGVILGETAVADLDHLSDVLKPGEAVDIVEFSDDQNMLRPSSMTASACSYLRYGCRTASLIRRPP